MAQVLVEHQTQLCAVRKEQEITLSCQTCIVLPTIPTQQMKQRTTTFFCLHIHQINLRPNTHVSLFRDSMTPETFLSEMSSVKLFSLLTGHVYSQCSEGMGIVCYALPSWGWFGFTLGHWVKTHVRSITGNERTMANRIKWKMEARCLSIQCGLFANLLFRRMFFLSSKAVGRRPTRWRLESAWDSG